MADSPDHHDEPGQAPAVSSSLRDAVDEFLNSAREQAMATVEKLAHKEEQLAEREKRLDERETNLKNAEDACASTKERLDQDRYVAFVCARPSVAHACDCSSCMLHPTC